MQKTKNKTTTLFGTKLTSNYYRYQGFTANIIANRHYVKLKPILAKTYLLNKVLS